MCFFVFNPLHIHLYHLFTINDILSLSLSSSPEPERGADCAGADEAF